MNIGDYLDELDRELLRVYGKPVESDKMEKFKEDVIKSLQELGKQDTNKEKGFLGFGNCLNCGCTLQGRPNESCVLVGVYCPNCTQG